MSRKGRRTTRTRMVVRVRVWVRVHQGGTTPKTTAGNIHIRGSHRSEVDDCRINKLPATASTNLRLQRVSERAILVHRKQEEWEAVWWVAHVPAHPFVLRSLLALT